MNPGRSMVTLIFWMSNGMPIRIVGNGSDFTVTCAVDRIDEQRRPDDDGAEIERSGLGGDDDAQRERRTLVRARQEHRGRRLARLRDRERCGPGAGQRPDRPDLRRRAAGAGRGLRPRGTAARHRRDRAGRRAA